MSGGPSDRDVLVSLTDEVIVPAYQAMARDMAQLDQDVKALCDSPSSAGLEDARRSWLAARASWMRSEATWFGPVMERRSVSLLDWSPVDTTGVDRLLADGGSVAASDVRDTLASNHRGSGAIEHVLFSNDALGTPDSSARRCSYLAALTTVAREETDAILAAWVEGTERQPAYKDFFSNRSDSAMLPSAAVAEVVRTQVFLIRDMVDMRLASALGLRGGDTDLSAIPGASADNGLQDLHNEVLGMQAIYEGSAHDGLGLSDLILPLSEETDRSLRDQFVSVVAAIDSVEGTLRSAVVERPDQVRSVYDRLLNVQRTIATQVVSLLGISVGFTDTDGDSLR